MVRGKRYQTSITTLTREKVERWKLVGTTGCGKLVEVLPDANSMSLQSGNEDMKYTTHDKVAEMLNS